MTVHIVGAGLSGLAAAIALTKAGVPVALYEAAAQAGGRCRSYHDRVLDRVIDNGNHLVLSGNDNVQNYLQTIGAEDRLVGPAGEGFRFLDLTRNREFWVRPNAGRIPWWVFSRARRVPGTHAGQYLAATRLRWASANATTTDILAQDELYRVLWEPLIVSALNTPADEASAQGFWRVLSKTLLKGGAKSRPLIAKNDLADTLVTPALNYLAARNVVPRFGARLRQITVDSDKASALDFDDGAIQLSGSDRVVLALPSVIAERMVPGLVAPSAEEAIVNAHFATSDPAGTPLEVVAIVGGAAHWVFRRPGLASVTVSAARGMVDEPAEALGPKLWADVARAFPALGAAVPPFRIVKEKRATIRQSPVDEAMRPPAETNIRNLWLAGDWTNTGLPATIEGSILSGFRAARLAQSAGAA